MYQRNIKAHTSDKDNELSTVPSLDHSYSTNHTTNKANYSPDTVPVSDQLTDPDIDVVREELCVTEGEDLEVDYGMDSVDNVGSDLRGRVIVDLDILFKSLVCQQCSMPLDPSTCKGLHRYGVCGYASITCSNPACNLINKVPLGKTHRQAAYGPAIFDVNTKICIGQYISIVSI